jgi:hypothetical protein
MRRAMTKAAYYGKVIFFGPCSRGDFLDDIHILVVAERFRRGSLQDSCDIGDCIDGELEAHGAIIMVVRRADFDRQKDERSTGVATGPGRYPRTPPATHGMLGSRPLWNRPV